MIRKDHLSPEARHNLMSSIRGSGTNPERQLARLLRASKIKFRRQVKSLPGKPDFLIVGRKIAIFVDGEFWHGRKYQNIRMPLSDYWVSKIEGNIRRDRRVRKDLRRMGWCVLRFWDTDIARKPMSAIDRIRRYIDKIPD